MCAVIINIYFNFRSTQRFRFFYSIRNAHVDGRSDARTVNDNSEELDVFDGSDEL